MKVYLFTYTRQGVDTSLKIRDCLAPDGQCTILAPERFSGEGVEPLTESLEKTVGALWQQADALIFVAAAGVAVRAIARFVKDKTTDPAVVCVDVMGQYAISLLSGHIGGGNRITRQIAQGIDALPVITTATDINQRFAVDEWAQQQGFVISSMQAAKAVSAAILEGDVPMQADVQVMGTLPPGLILSDKGQAGIAFSVFTHEPYPQTLRLIPKVLTLGIGCRKGVSADQMERAVCAVFEKNKLDIRAVEQAASIDIKQEEAGLLAFCKNRGIPLVFYSAQQLGALPGAFTASEFVRHTIGVDNVCERAALMRGGKLIVSKTAVDGVTVAVAEEAWEVRF
jgi:cobalt-precorrin 5A hydrolase